MEKLAVPLYLYFTLIVQFFYFSPKFTPIMGERMPLFKNHWTRFSFFFPSLSWSIYIVIEPLKLIFNFSEKKIEKNFWLTSTKPTQLSHVWYSLIFKLYMFLISLQIKNNCFFKINWIKLITNPDYFYTPQPLAYNLRTIVQW